MNAHSAWDAWQKQYRIPVSEADFTREFPCPIRYDWKGVGMEGAFKAGYMASSAELAKRSELVARLAVAEDRLAAIKEALNQ